MFKLITVIVIDALVIDWFHDTVWCYRLENDTACTSEETPKILFAISRIKATQIAKRK